MGWAIPAAIVASALLTNKGSETAKDAASIQAQQFTKGLEELRRQFDASQSNISPFLEAGQRALPFLEQGASVGGLDRMLAEILATDTLGSLVNQRRRSVTDALAAGGLTRSGVAVDEAAAIPADLLLQISEMLTGNARSLATRGQNAAVGAGTQSGQFGSSVANLLGQKGNALASGILGKQQAQSQGIQNALALATLGMDRGGRR